MGSEMCIRDSTPSNHEFYFRGYTEVPKCNDNCPTNDRFDDPNSQGGQNYSSMIQQHGATSYQSQGSGSTQFQQSGYPLHQQGSGTSQFQNYPTGGQYQQQIQPVQNGNSSGGGFGWPQGNNN